MFTVVTVFPSATRAFPLMFTVFSVTVIGTSKKVSASTTSAFAKAGSVPSRTTGVPGAAQEQSRTSTHSLPSASV